MLTDEERFAARKLCDEGPPSPEADECGEGCEHIECAYVVRLEWWAADHRRKLATLLPAALSDLALMYGRVLGLGAVVDMRGATIARLETENRRLSEALHEVSTSATDRSRRLSAERDETLAKLAALEVALRSLRPECLASYAGGYQTEAERDVFRHGMETVCNVVDAALKRSEKGEEHGDDQ
jgi:soluble cytochrome b562